MSKTDILSYCQEQLKIKNIFDDLHKKRLEEEWKEISAQDQQEYFGKLFMENRKFSENENNLLTPYLLGIVDGFDITKNSTYDYGESPDVDIDYLDGVREYLKEDYAKREFGEKYICNIANYNTMGIKGALKDMARIFGLDHNEVEDVTRNLNKSLDDEGNKLDWDETLELFDELKDYCNKYPEVADAAKKMVGRIRGRGQHASGLIVSSVPIREYIPLIAGKGEAMAAAWPEGQSSTDCSTVGFVKFDFLGLDGNSKVADTCKMACRAKEKYEGIIEARDIIHGAVGNMTVCALPGRESWSDTSYLEDPKALALAKRGDLRMVFQFDGSPGIRNLAKQIRVDKFDDLVATTALFRPGPMKLRYHEEYAARKNGKYYTVHPSLAEGPGNLSFTYGVLTYQEQVGRLLNTVGKVPWKDCEVIRKAISKKKIEKFQKYKDAFIEEGQKTLGESREYLEELWEQVEAFAGYGFNLSHAVGYTYISSRMLWLKANLPNHFFASMFTNTKAAGPKDYQKLKEYKQEATKLGVSMAGLDINKSKNDFVLNEDGKIYYGFCKIKGIGEDLAQKIESLQPYANFEDFLQKFGTDARALHPLIALGCFKDHTPMMLYKFYEYYKKWQKAELDRHNRFKVSSKKMQEELEAAQATEDQTAIRLIERKIERAIAIKDRKDRFVERPTLKDFDPEKITITLKLNKTMEDVLADESGDLAQVEFYGFVWSHPIEKCPGYQGQTINEFLDSNMKDGKVEVVIKSVEQKKGPKATYYSVMIEDASGCSRKLNVWQDDFERFEEEFTVGNFVRLHIVPPVDRFPLGMYQFPGSRWRKPAKSSDYRVVQIG